MATSRVYRLETPSGEGVFRDAAAEDYRNEGRHQFGHDFMDPFDYPCPHQDGIPKVDYNNVCGFISIEQMLEWFRHLELYPTLEKHEIEVKIFEIHDEHIVHGGHQVMFPRHLARVVEQSKPSDFARNLKICAKL
jgi:hypothetical protein